MSESEIMIEWELLSDVPDYVGLKVGSDWEFMLDGEWKAVTSPEATQFGLPLSIPSLLRRPKSKWIIVTDSDAIIEKDWQISLKQEGVWRSIQESWIGRTVKDFNQIWTHRIRCPYVQASSPTSEPCRNFSCRRMKDCGKPCWWCATK